MAGKLSAKDRKTVTFAPSRRPPDRVVKSQLCVNTSPPSGNRTVTVKHTVATVGYTPVTGGKVSLEHPSAVQKALAVKTNSENEILHNRNYDNLEDCLALSTSFRKPVDRVLISLPTSLEVQHRVVRLLDTSAGSNLVKNTFLSPS